MAARLYARAGVEKRSERREQSRSVAGVLSARPAARRRWKRERDGERAAREPGGPHLLYGSYNAPATDRTLGDARSVSDGVGYRGAGRRSARHGEAARVNDATLAQIAFGGGVLFSKVAPAPYFATILFFVSRLPVISMTNVGTRRLLMSATHFVSSVRGRDRRGRAFGGPRWLLVAAGMLAATAASIARETRVTTWSAACSMIAWREVVPSVRLIESRVYGRSCLRHDAAAAAARRAGLGARRWGRAGGLSLA